MQPLTPFALIALIRPQLEQAQGDLRLDFGPDRFRATDIRAIGR